MATGGSAVRVACRGLACRRSGVGRVRDTGGRRSGAGARMLRFRWRSLAIVGIVVLVVAVGAIAAALLA